MHTLPLQIRDGHVFIRIEDDQFLLDTGAPTSFGSSESLSIAGQQFPLKTGYMGLTADTLSEYVGGRTNGLLGADILNLFDLVLDSPGATATFSTEELKCDGEVVPLEVFMGIPIISAQIGSATCRMFFDTGAQISYLQDDLLTNYPSAGQVTDFYPGFGQFQTDTHAVDVRLGKSSFTVRCGSLPTLLGMTLMMAGTNGVLGNEVLQGRRAGYFPRRKRLVL